MPTLNPKTSKAKNITVTIVSEILYTIKDLADLMPLPFETPYAHIRRIRQLGHKNYDNAIRRLIRQGEIKITKKNSGSNFICLTPKGNLRVLFAKAKIRTQKKWDGKWRAVVFDIPEKSRILRGKLRIILQRNNFYRLQHSVFIHPYSFNREAIGYLKETGLDKYIRILRVDEIDDDRVLKKYFNL